MNIPSNYNITLRVDGSVIKLNLKEEFAINEDSLIDAPLNLSYLTGLQYRMLVALYESKLDMDKYYSSQYIIEKDSEGPYPGRPPSDTLIDQTIKQDETYSSLRIYYEAQKAQYELISNIIEAYKIRIETLRTLSANRRREQLL